MAAVGILAGCSSAEDQPVEAAASVDGGISPISAAVGVELEGEFAEAATIEALQRAEEDMQRCMASRGFEYLPAAINSRFGTASKVGQDLDPVQFALTYGLGLVPVFVESLDASPEDARPEPDPNEQIYSELSEAEQLNWYLALWGYESGPANYDPIPGRNLPESCFDLATAKLTQLGELLEPFHHEFESLDELVSQDARIVEADAAWSKCMASEGYSFGSELLMRQWFLDRLQSSYAPAQSDGPQPIGTTDEQVVEELESLAELERGAAMANIDCSAGQAALYQLVRFEVESQFVADNEDRLDILADRLSTVRDE